MRAKGAFETFLLGKMSGIKIAPLAEPLLQHGTGFIFHQLRKFCLLWSVIVCEVSFTFKLNFEGDNPSKFPAKSPSLKIAQ